MNKLINKEQITLTDGRKATVNTYKYNGKEFWWNIISANGEITASCWPETFKNKKDCIGNMNHTCNVLVNYFMLSKDEEE